MLLLLSFAHAATPALSISLTVPPSAGSPAAVEDALRPLSADLLACLRKGGQAPLAAAVDVGMDGGVTAATVPVPNGSDAERCTLELLRGVRFPAPASPSTILVGLLPPPPVATARRSSS